MTICGLLLDIVMVEARDDRGALDMVRMRRVAQSAYADTSSLYYCVSTVSGADQY